MNLELSNKFLYIKTEPWDFSSPPMDISELAESIVAFMYSKGGIGLSANQVGIPYAVFAMRGWGGPDGDYVIINPRIVHASEATIELEEACLSHPGLVIERTRPVDIRVRFQTPSGETFTKPFQGMFSRIVQHEMDHLNGLPFWDKVSRLKFDMAIKKARKKGFPLEEIKWKN